VGGARGSCGYISAGSLSFKKWLSLIRSSLAPCLKGGCYRALLKQGAPSICHHRYSYLGFLTPFLLIFYPCKIFCRCLNCCHKRRWHALHTFVEAYHGCYKNGVTGGWDFRSMSGVYMLFRLVLVIVNYSNSYSNQQISWLLHVLMFLGRI